MALAIDSSTPAGDTVPHIGNTATTTHAFSPPAGSVIFVFVIGAGPTSPAVQSVSGITDNLGVPLGWALYPGARDNTMVGGTLEGNAEVWWAYCPNAQTNMIITVTFTANNDNSGSNPAGIVQPVVFTGAAPIQNGSANTRSSTTTGAPSVSLTTVGNGSRVIGVANNWTNSTVPTVPASQTTTINGNSTVVQNATEGDVYWVQTQNSTTPTAGTTVTINDTAPSVKYHMAVVEVLADNPIPLYWVQGVNTP
jgi:hypothetical protein